MSTKKRLLYCLIGCVVLAFIVDLAKRCDHAEVIKVERDTVVVYDTIPHYYPVPKDSAVVRYITRVLPSMRDGIAQYSNGSDTVYHVIGANNMVEHYADTSKMIAVEVPITSKHYNTPEYDAWVSGYEANLDSIKVYRRTEYITERVTVSKRPNKWELDAVAGSDYLPRHDQYTPRAALELTYKPNRLQVGVRAGVIKSDNFEPFVGAVMKVRLF